MTRNHKFKLSVLVFSLISLSPVYSQSFYCKNSSIEQNVGGYRVNVCGSGDLQGLVEKENNGDYWTGEYGESAITLYRLGKEKNHLWMLTTPFKNVSLKNLDYKIRSIAFLINFNCDTMQSNVLRSITYAKPFGEGDILSDTIFHDAQAEHNSRMLLVPCSILLNK